MAETLTPTESQQLINELNAEYRRISDSMKVSGAVPATIDILKQAQTDIQDTVNSIFKKGGIITEDEYNKAYEIMRRSKEADLKKSQKKANARLVLYIVGALAVAAGVYFFTRKKSK